MTLTQISTAGVKDNAVTSGKIPADAIGNSELAPNAVSATEIQNNAIQTVAIQDNAVTTAKIADDAVTAAKLANTSVSAGQYGSSTAIPIFTVDAQGRITSATQNTFTGTTINNNADNRVITGSGTANTLEGEATLTYNGTDTFELQPASATPAIFIGDSNRSGAGQGLVQYKGNWNGTTVARITMDSGSDTTNKDDGIIRFDTAAAGSVAESMRIDSSGRMLIGTTTVGAKGASSPLQVQTANSGAFAITIKNRASNNDYGFIGFTDDDASEDLAQIGVQRTAADTGDIFFYTNGGSSSSNERVRIKSSGKVGIGEDSPSKTLHIKTTTSDDGILLKSSTGNYFTIAGDANRDTDGQSLIRFEGKWNGTAVGRISMLAGADTTNKDDGHIAFAIADGGSMSEAMRINQYGFVKMKGDMSSHMSATGNNYHEMQADNPNIQILNMRHGSSNGYGVMAQFNHGKSTHWAYRVYNYASGSDNLFVRTDGDLENINNSYGSTSDAKLKENIVDAPSQWDDIKALRVRNFNYIADTSNKKLLGLVAQEAETVCPSLVKEQPDLDVDNKDLGTTTKYLKYSILYMKAIKALQEAQTRIETLETKVTALEAA